METETTSSSTPTPETSGGGSYVQELLGGPVATAASVTSTEGTDGNEPGTSPAQTNQTTQTTESEKPETQTTAPAAPATLEEILAKLAQEHDVDLNAADEKILKVLKRAANKEFFIQKLQSQNRELLANRQASEESDTGLTDFEREQMAAQPQAEQPRPQTAQQPLQQQPQQATQPVSPLGQFNDGFDTWQKEEDAYTALNEAWTANDLGRVAQIENAKHLRQTFGMTLPIVMPRVQQLVNQMLEQRLADVLPHVEADIQAKRESTTRNFAIEQLSSALPDFADMFTETEGPPIVFDGMEFPNTPLNQVLAANPGIMKITSDNPNKDVALKQSMIDRYRTAYKAWKNSMPPAIDLAKAKEFMNAGAQMRERTKNEGARQTINAGPGATGLGSGNARPSYIGNLNSPTGEISISDYAKKFSRK